MNFFDLEKTMNAFVKSSVRIIADFEEIG